MYGTVARMRVKPGKEAEFLADARAEEEVRIPGYIGMLVYRMDRVLNEYMVAVVFTDEDSYFRNADSPEQEARYYRMREFLEADPEWYDGEIVRAWISEALAQAQSVESVVQAQIA